LQYSLEFDTSATNNCVKSIGLAGTKNLLAVNTETWLEFDDSQDELVSSIIRFNIPDGTPLCSQKIRMQVRDTQKPGDTFLASKSFSIQDYFKGIILVSNCKTFKFLAD
jgi:hypothetical protein